MEPGEYRIVNTRSKGAICERAVCAMSLAERTGGLLGRECLPSGEALLIVSPPWLRVMWLHTFGMRFAIDIVFLNSAMRVLKLEANVVPWRLSAVVLGARYVLEMSCGTIARTGIRCGDTLFASRANTGTSAENEQTGQV